LLALAVPSGHAALDPEDSVVDEAQANAWSVMHRPAFLFYVGSLSATVRSRLERLAPSYSIDRREDDMDGCWANHCVQCGACLGDHELFCEPDGAFVPTSQSRAGSIRLSATGEPFAALAAGYIPDPPFFDAMCKE